MTTIGQMMGVVDHAFSITNDHGDKVTLSVKIDFRTASDQACRGWSTSDRIIAGARPWRSLSKNEIQALNGQTFIAQDIGRKIKSREERIQVRVNAGMPEKLAIAAEDNPEEYQKISNEIMAEYEARLNKTVDEDEDE